MRASGVILVNCAAVYVWAVLFAIVLKVKILRKV